MKRNLSVIFLFMIILMLLSPSISFARENGPWVKLGRGICNILSSPVEIPYRMAEIGKHERWPIAIAGGFFKGAVYMVVRTVVGVYEIVTFPIPVPANYEVILPPDFIIPAG